MRAAIVVCVAFWVAGCASFPPAARGRADSGLTLHVITLTSEPDGMKAQCRLENRSTTPFTYLGYSSGEPTPYGSTEVRPWLRWRWVRVPGCGTGLENVVVASGTSVQFTVRVLVVRTGRDALYRVVLREMKGERIVRSQSFNLSRAVRATIRQSRSNEQRPPPGLSSRDSSI